MKLLILILLLIVPTTSWTKGKSAGDDDGALVTTVDIETKSVHLITADAGLGFRYYIDRNACLCWIMEQVGQGGGIAVFDCSKLKAHSRLLKFLDKCK